jgi:CRISPR-associated protein (TIGR02584 family)
VEAGPRRARGRPGASLKPVALLAAPGGNPAHLASLVWGLAQRGELVVHLELVLYASAARYLEAEFEHPGGPLEQLRGQLGGLTCIERTLVRDARGQALEEDAALEDHLAFARTVWARARALGEGGLPVIYGLVGGRRRTLTVDLATTFQLLARPEDRLVDLRLHPKYADDPRTGFAFPGQESEARVPAALGAEELLSAAEVRVELVEVLVPRLGHALLEGDREDFAKAVAAGERAARLGGVPDLHIDVLNRRVRFGSVEVRLSRDQMVWFVALAQARQGSEEGWLDARDVVAWLPAVEHCLAAWKSPASELSDGFDPSDMPEHKRMKWLGPLRSKLRRRLRDALAGHPHWALVVPEKSPDKRPVERLTLEPGRVVWD